MGNESSSTYSRIEEPYYPKDDGFPDTIGGSQGKGKGKESRCDRAATGEDRRGKSRCTSKAPYQYGRRNISRAERTMSIAKLGGYRVAKVVTSWTGVDGCPLRA